MGIYYLYINSNELNEILVKNTIYPTREVEKFKSLSLCVQNGIFITQNKLSEQTIIDTCEDGFNTPVILEVELDLKSTIYREIDEGLVLFTPITFNAVNKIYYVTGKIHRLIFSDIYIFESLLSKDKFECGNVYLDKEKISLLQFDYKYLDNYFDKIQAFYCCRFGFLEDIKIEKKKVVFKRNIDLESFKYVSNLPYEVVIKNIFGFLETKNYQASIIGEETTFINDNFQDILQAIVNNDDYDTNNEDAEFYYFLYKISLDSNVSDFKENLCKCDALHKYVKEVLKIKEECKGNITLIKKKFSEARSRKLIILFVVVEIVNKDLENALLYISNFTSQNSELKKELISIYGLVCGMEAMDETIKSEASILLFSFNSSKKYFSNYCDICEDYLEYYKKRSYKVDWLLNDGFNFKIFDYKEELKYINQYILQLLSKNGFDEKNLSKKIYKNNKFKELHKMFLCCKKGELQ